MYVGDGTPPALSTLRILRPSVGLLGPRRIMSDPSTMDPGDTGDRLSPDSNDDTNEISLSMSTTTFVRAWCGGTCRLARCCDSDDIRRRLPVADDLTSRVLRDTLFSEPVRTSTSTRRPFSLSSSSRRAANSTCDSKIFLGVGVDPSVGVGVNDIGIGICLGVMVAEESDRDGVAARVLGCPNPDPASREAREENNNTSAGALCGIVTTPARIANPELDPDADPIFTVGAIANAFRRHATAALEITTFSTLRVDARSSDSFVCVWSVCSVCVVCPVCAVSTVGACEFLRDRDLGRSVGES